MTDAKTRATDAGVDDHLASKAGADQRADCRTLMAILAKVTRQAPRMWGPSIVGYGSYRYTYASGRTGESCLTGFAIRGRDLVVYLMAEAEGQPALLARLGKHKAGKGCLVIRRLADLDLAVLEALVAGSVAEVGRRHGAASSG